MSEVFEDFVPISASEALITVGETLTSLTWVVRVGYAVEGGRVVLGEQLGTLAAGTHIRLGGLFDGRLVYSDDGVGVVGAEVKSLTAHQPFVTEHGIYYTDDAPTPRIYRDGELFLDHFDGMAQVGNPCWAGDWMYFECRRDPDPTRPDLWEVWRRHKDGGTEYVCRGANPACYGDRLYLGEWNGRGFDYRCSARD